MSETAHSSHAANWETLYQVPVVGREALLSSAKVALGESRFCHLIGEPGSGRTRIAQELTRGLDPVWVDCEGVDSVGQLCERFAAALEVEVEADPSLATTQIAETLDQVGRPVVFDDLPANPSIVRAVRTWHEAAGDIPMTLVSRGPLGMNTVSPTVVGPFDPPSSLALAKEVRRIRGLPEPCSTAEEIHDSSGGLPLLIELFAANELSAGDCDVVGRCLKQLTADQAQMLGRLTALGGSVSSACVQASVSDLTLAPDTLSSLLKFGLVRDLGGSDQRFRVPPSVSEQVVVTDEARGLLDRVLNWARRSGENPESKLRLLTHLSRNKAFSEQDRLSAGLEAAQLLYDHGKFHSLNHLVNHLPEGTREQELDRKLWLARAEVRLHRSRRALRLADAAMAENPSSEQQIGFLKVRSTSLADLGDTEQAKECIGQALTLCGTDSIAGATLWQDLASIHAIRNELPEARAAVQRGIALVDDPEHPFRMVLGITRCVLDLQAGLYDEVVSQAVWMDEVCHRTGQAGLGQWARHNIAFGHWHLGEIEKAAAAFARIGQPSDRRLNVWVRTYSALTAHELGDADRAAREIQEAERAAAGRPRAGGIVSFAAAVMALASGNPRAAQARLDESAALDPASVYILPMRTALSALLRNGLGAEQGDRSTSDALGQVPTPFHADARSFVAWARFRLSKQIPGEEFSRHGQPLGGWARLLMQPVEAYLPVLKYLTSERTLVLVDGSRLDLSRRPALRKIVGQLFRNHALSEPALGVHELFQVGWSEPHCPPDAASARVYVAIRRLRRLGLGELLETTEAGYCLSPGIRTEVIDTGVRSA